MCDDNWVEPGWQKQLNKKPLKSLAKPSVLTIEGFESAPSCSQLDKMDRSHSADGTGSLDLLTLFNEGYAGKKGMEGVKRYWNDCFGIPFECSVIAAKKFAQFSGPYGLTLDSSDNVYVADMRNNRIRKISPSGIVTTVAGSGVRGTQDGTGNSATFAMPAGIAVATDGTLYVSDYGSSRIRKIAPNGTVTTLAGGNPGIPKDGAGTTAVFNQPTGLAIGPDGTIYVADTLNSAVRKITPSGYVTTLAGGKAQGYLDGAGANAKLGFPAGITVDARNNVYITEIFNNRIRMITPGGVVTTIAGDGYGGGKPGSGHLVDGNGQSAGFDSALGITVGKDGIFYVADTYNECIRRMTSGGDVSVFAGGTTPGANDGTGKGAAFSKPSGVALDSKGNVFVADQFNNGIRKITPAGVVTTFAGSGAAGWVDS
jgi:sugar lactone lactonase YvrE